MIRRSLFGLLCALPLASAVAEEPVLTMPEIPKLTVTLDPDDAVEAGGHVQGQLVLKVQIASRFAFEELDVRLPEIADAEVLRLQRPRTRQVRSYGGEGHVFETALAIFPTRRGPLEIPGVEVRGVVEPKPGRELSFDDRSRDLRIEVAGIAPRYGDPWWLVSDRVEMTETWSKPIEDLRFGDIVRREVTVVASGATAAHMPVLASARTRGITTAEAGRTARTERRADGVTAIVTQAWDLKVETDNVAYISPMRIAYWHPGERKEMRASLPGMRIEPLPADRQALAASLLREAQEAHRRNWALAITLPLVLLSPLAILGLGALWLARPTRADRALAKACIDAATPKDLYRAVSVWAVASDIDLRASQRATLLGAAKLGDAIASGPLAAYGQVEQRIFSMAGPRVDGVHLARGLTRLSRRRRLSALRNALYRAVDRILGPRLQIELPQR